MQNEIVGVLDEDHVRLGELAAGLRACPRPAFALRQFDEFAQLLGGHLLVMKRIVYPALKTIGWKDVSSVLLLGHARLSRGFAELLTLKRANGAFADALSDLLDATEHLLEAERTELRPILVRHFSVGARLAMAADAVLYLPPRASAGAPPAVHTLRQSARDWVEEARLLLSGLRPEPFVSDAADGGDTAPAP